MRTLGRVLDRKATPDEANPERGSLSSRVSRVLAQGVITASVRRLPDDTSRGCGVSASFGDVAGIGDSR